MCAPQSLSPIGWPHEGCAHEELEQMVAQSQQLSEEWWLKVPHIRMSIWLATSMCDAAYHSASHHFPNLWPPLGISYGISLSSPLLSFWSLCFASSFEGEKWVAVSGEPPGNQCLLGTAAIAVRSDSWGSRPLLPGQSTVHITCTCYAQLLGNNWGDPALKCIATG